MFDLPLPEPPTCPTCGAYDHDGQCCKTRPALTEPCPCFACKLAEQERRALPALEDA